MIGRVIDGFVLNSFQGKGTFGSVFQCEKNGQRYAMKIFSADAVFSEFSKNDDNRITREIEALKTVDSPFVVKYITDGYFIDNSCRYYYVVMDYVEGEDLECVLKERSFSIAEARQIFISILKGIDSIHQKQLIHRDLKPANIYLLHNGDIKILDFGLSKLIDFTSITNTGDQLGTPLYMSPEQISDSKNIDYRSDYYALGVIFFKLLTNNTPYGNITSRDELYYKIKVEPPIPVRTIIPTIHNSIDNLIESLLAKENYKRPRSVQDILHYLTEETKVLEKQEVFQPSFFVRVWNEKKVLQEFYADGFSIEHAIFPINHQKHQKNLLQLLKEKQVDYIIDPATMRLAYDSYSDVKGLVALPYAPRDLSRLEVDDLSTHMQRQKYVKLVIDEQLQHKSPYVVAPFHISNNSNLVKIKMDLNENWFSLDVKLAQETKDYLEKKGYSGKFVSGFCIKADLITTRTERDYFLNVLSALKCDMYWLYVDCINNKSNFSQLYNYANMLLELQNTTHKPVIAGRIGAFGLVLLAFGLYGFESGTARFESFSEDLYKEPSESYNMYVRYYFPELLNSVAIERKNPVKIMQLLATETGKDISCTCPYCREQDAQTLVDDGLTKKHFLYRRNEEINNIRAFSSIEERVTYVEMQIKDAIQNYKKLKPIFRDEEAKFLTVWLDVIKKLKDNWLV